MAKRISLTATQRQSGIGAELLVLCQHISEDGTLSLEEVKALINWLNANRNTKLPAKDYLFDVVNRIIADKRVTPNEQRELYEAIEIILPPDSRKIAIQQRKEFEAEIKHRERLSKAASKQQERDRREMASPIEIADFMVAGVHHEGRGEVVERFVGEGQQVFLARDETNRFSSHAIEVRLGNGISIGFVPENFAIELSPYLDDGHPHWAFVKKILTGGSVPIPVVVANVYAINTTFEHAVTPAAVPSKSAMG